MLMLVQRRKKMVEEVIESIKTITLITKNTEAETEAEVKHQLKELQKEVNESGHPDREYISDFLIGGLIDRSIPMEEVFILLERLIKTM